jgi:hypothetical protein
VAVDAAAPDGVLSTVATEASHAPMAVRLTSTRDRHHRSVVTRHVMRHRGFCRPVVDNAGHDAITPDVGA